MPHWSRLNKISARAALKWMRRFIRSIFCCGKRTGKVQCAPDSAMDLKQPALPISFPLTSLEQLRDGALFSSFHFAFDKSSVPLKITGQQHKRKKSKLLVCHDMKGGYQDDRFVQGDDNGKAYSLWHWQCIDIFVYFSHSLVTIPPPSWINAGHAHGVQVLGTFITEWDQGVQVCQQLLQSEDTAHTYASRLAEIAHRLGFDGWLINIENKISSTQIATLQYFLKELTQEMHKLVPNSLVIWYDAVTIDGKLEWQDRLTDKNKPFFDVTDGIFINYTWKEDYPALSAKVAGDRAFDVYMGVDVFGRNTYGGGGYQSDVALKAALKGGVSAALFAPGWIYENDQSPLTFEEAQIKFWGLIHEVWPVAHNNPVTLPFFTDFSQGIGSAVYIDGNEVSASPWSNISCQTLQPLLEGWSSTQPPVFEAAVRSVDPIYSGGSSLRFSGALGSSEMRSTKLYQANVLLTEATMFIEFSVLPTKSNAQFCLALTLQDADGIHILILPSASDSDLEACREEIAGAAGHFLHVVRPQKSTNSASWKVSGFHMEVQRGATLSSIDGICSFGAPNLKRLPNILLPELPVSETTELPKAASDAEESYELHLGHLRITTSKDCFKPQPSSPCLQADDCKWSQDSNGNRLLSVRLKWRYQGKFSRYNIYVDQQGSSKMKASSPKYLGAAFVQAFYVDNLVIEAGVTSVVFRLQPRCSAGYTQKVEETPKLALHVPSKAEDHEAPSPLEEV